MYFPQRFREWLLTCLPHRPHPFPDVFEFHLVRAGECFALEFRDLPPTSEVCVDPLPIPEGFCGASNAECIEALTVLFQGQMTRGGRIGEALGGRVVLHTSGGVLDIHADQVEVAVRRDA